MKYVKFLIMILASCHITMAQAVDDVLNVASISEEDYFEEIPQVLTIARLRQRPQDVPTASTIIDRQMIEDSGVIDLAEIFRLVPGFYVAQNAGFIVNTNHVVSYHGFSDAYARRMQVLIDGRTLYQPMFGGIQWSEIPITIQDIDRIEVTRGPNSASYGANAFLGTINIITKLPTGASANRISASHGNGRNELFYHHSGKTENAAYWLTTGYKDDDGLKDRLDFKRTKLLSLRANYKASPQDDIEFIAGYAKGDRQEGFTEASLLGTLYNDRLFDTYNHNEQLKWTHRLNNGGEFYIQAYHALDHKNDALIAGPLTALGFSPDIQTFSNAYRFQRYDLESQYSYSNQNNFQFALGGSVRRDRLYAPLWLGSEDTDDFNLQRLFAQMQYNPHTKVSFNTGLMVEHNDFTGTNTSPRASINVHLTPQHTVRGSYSEAYRTPSYLEEKFKAGMLFTTPDPSSPALYQRFFNTGNLSPEKIQSRELSYIGQWKNISIDAKLFSDTISQIIQEVDNDDFASTLAPGVVLINPTNVGTFVNFGSMDVRGFETQIKVNLTPQTHLLLNHAHVRNFPNAVKQNRAENYRQSTPRNITSFLLSHHHDQQWRLSLAGYYSSAVKALGDGGEVGSSLRLDSRIAKKFTVSRLNGEFSLNIQNLTDSHDKEFANYNTLRRRAYINVSLGF